MVAAMLLGRLLHHAFVIEIAVNGYGLREHAKLVPGSLRLRLISDSRQKWGDDVGADGCVELEDRVPNLR